MAESPSLLLLGMLALELASVHIDAGYLRFLDVMPRSRWLSLASGVSVAYVFIHMLPELSHHQAQLFEGKTGRGWTWLDHHMVQFLPRFIGTVHDGKLVPEPWVAAGQVLAEDRRVRLEGGKGS